MIRILHTADWHVGQTLRGFSREHEHRKVFGRLEEIVVERNVDALVVAGDVFDSQNPSGEAQQLLYNALVRLSRAQPRMTVVIVAGNHDAAGRLEAPRPLLEAFTIRVVGNVRRRNRRSRRRNTSCRFSTPAVQWPHTCWRSPTQLPPASRI